MAIVYLVESVRYGHDGDVRAVRWGRCDTAANEWLPGFPLEADVLDVVDALMSGDVVFSRLANGGAGPRLKVVPGKVHATETINVDGDLFKLEEIAVF